MEFVRVNKSTEGHHVRMVGVNRPVYNTLEPCLGFVMYEEMSDKIYALALDLCLVDPEAIWTVQDLKGTMARCILAM
eukprot:6314279-Heterocapsa_arctica.AAC.1